MLRNIGTIPIDTPHEMRRLLNSMILAACSIEQKNYSDDTDLATLADGANYEFNHSADARYRRIVQVYQGASRELVTSGLTVQLTDSDTTTIENNSGSDWTNVYINILLY